MIRLRPNNNSNLFLVFPISLVFYLKLTPSSLFFLKLDVEGKVGRWLQGYNILCKGLMANVRV